MGALPVVQDGAASLRGLVNAVAGEVRLGAHDRMLYATDASIYQVEPLAVVVPASVEDAQAAVAYCSRHGLAVLPRGGGTSLAGQCTNKAVVIDLSANCRALLRVDGVRGRAEVEPGITIDDLNDALAGMEDAAAWFFAPDPATSRQANVGGCIGNNAAGARSIRFGRTSENVARIDAALADGTRVRFDAGSAAHDAHVARLTRGVCEIVAGHAALIRARFPKTVRRNAGYGLDMILKQMEAAGWRDGGAIDPALPARINLTPLLCGSEGTLAVTLGAGLILHPRPKAKGLAVLAFEDLDAAIAAVPGILTTNPTAVELLDDTVIDLARANIECRRYVDLMPSPAAGSLRAVLYVEYFGASAGEIQERFDALRRVCPGVNAQFHTDAAAMLNAWKLRKAGEPLLHGIPGRRKPITFVEDNAIPVEHLARFVKDLRGIVERHGTRAAFYAHASVGVLHVRPLIDLHDVDDRRRMREIAVETADLARSLGGVMSGEHGDGRVRTPLLERFYGPELMSAFARIKRLFDPGNVLNPGNIVDLSGHDPRPIESITGNLRVDHGGARPDAAAWSGVETYFEYQDQHGFDGAVEMCNGAGVCRKKQGGTMCPSYMATLDERHSTRGRGNALRLAITGQFTGGSDGSGVTRWDDIETRRTLDLCLSCKACKTECPSNVDIARLKAEYAAQGYRERGRPPLKALAFGNVRLLNRLGSIAPGIANYLGNGPLRGLLNLVMGLHGTRSLPRFDTPLTTRWRRSPTAPDDRPRVVLFGDCFTMFNEPGIGLATRRVFEACGYEVVLADAGCCGRAKISMGLLPQASDEIDATIGRLGAWADDPRTRAVLVAEPSCLSAIKDDWLHLKVATPIELRHALAKRAFLPEDFLNRAWDAHPTRPPLRSSRARVVLHGHCHQKALWGAETSAAALRRAFASVDVLDAGCCGMAGSFGFARERFALSMKIGELGVLPAARAAGGAHLAAPGTSCRHQVLDGAGVRAVHPIELIAERLECRSEE